MKIQVQSMGIAVKNPKTKTIEIGKEKPTCPSCGAELKVKDTRCEICGAALGATAPNATAQSEPAPSRLSDEELAAKLKTQRTKATLAKVFLALCVIAAAISLFSQTWAVFVPSLMGIVVCLLLNISAKNKMKLLVSANIVRGALSGIFEVEVYDHERSIGRNTIDEAELISDWDECSGSDFVRGKYKGINFVFSDVHLVDVEVSHDGNGDRNETRTTRFRGQWIVLETSKELAHAVRIRERGTRKLLGGYQKSKTDVETENAAFNEQFQILTEDAHSAFYILTPHFMDYIISADKRSAGQTYMAFIDRSVHIAIDTGRDTFEVDKSSDVKNLTALRARIQGEVKHITSIVDELLQNDNLFGAE